MSQFVWCISSNEDKGPETHHPQRTEISLCFDSLSKQRQQQVEDWNAGGKGSEESANRNELTLTQNCFVFFEKMDGRSKLVSKLKTVKDENNH